MDKKNNIKFLKHLVCNEIITTETGVLLLCYTDGFSTKKTGRRLKEREIIRSMIQLFNASLPEYAHKANGQPYFKELPGTFLSVTHSEGYFAVYIDNKPCGVDIQFPHEKLTAGTDYFMNSGEQNNELFKNNPDFQHLIWCAKEAFFKLKSGEIDDLKEEVTIKTIANNILIIHYQQTAYRLSWKKWQDAFLVFT